MARNATRSATSFLLGDGLQIRSALARIERLCGASGCGLGVSEGRLSAEGSADRRLRHAVERARSGALESVLLFPNLERGTALVLEVAAGPGWPVRARLRRVDAAQLPTGEVIASALGLSPAEATLCRALAEGLPMRAYTSKRGISKHTARAQLAAVRKKTGARSQVQIANLIWMLAQTLDSG